MIIPDDIYRQTKVTKLGPDGGTYGEVHLTYEVRQVTDVRDLTWVRAYRVTCSQRVIIPADHPVEFGPTNVTGYTDYPVLIASTYTPKAWPDSHLRLLDYSPRTINSSVSTSRNDSQGDSHSTSRQHTSGSSTSETNSYSVNASFGFFGDDLTGSVGGDYSHSTTNERSRSSSHGSEQGTTRETGASESMSVKDWATYATLSHDDVTVPTWVWAQEYPWDVIQFRDCPTNTNQVRLPQFVIDRLFDSSSSPLVVLPPSQLSLFGVDFTMKAAWLVDLSPDRDKQTIEVAHDFEYAKGSHGLSPTPGTGYVAYDVQSDPKTITSGALDLTRLGLDPVKGSASGAVTGFAPSKFILGPTGGASFKIISDENTLHVSGTGFDVPMSSGFDHGAVQLAIEFKVIDADYDYTLYFKHWKSSANGCQLELVFNSDRQNPVYRHVDSAEGEGGDDNLTSVNLRNKDYTSVDYHDYLVMGMNRIDVRITPDDPGKPAAYVLRALAIGGS
ncbi:MAG TPA: hypothetical protein VFE15_11100 [Marmoricola sp.]|jgi:hypothetical protein|nr:hypothetical protein [Marmoricola sp.]